MTTSSVAQLQVQQDAHAGAYYMTMLLSSISWRWPTQCQGLTCQEVKSCKRRRQKAVPANFFSTNAGSVSKVSINLTPTSLISVIVNFCLLRITSTPPNVASWVASAKRWLLPGCQQQTKVSSQIWSHQKPWNSERQLSVHQSNTSELLAWDAVCHNKWTTEAEHAKSAKCCTTYA